MQPLWPRVVCAASKCAVCAPVLVLAPVGVGCWRLSIATFQNARGYVPVANVTHPPVDVPSALAGKVPRAALPPVVASPEVPEFARSAML